MEVDSGADSVSSTPRANPHNKLYSEDKSVIRVMCSFGGKILPRPHDNQLRYVGGDTRMVAVHRSTTYASLVLKLAKLLNSSSNENSLEFTVKYQLPNEDLDALITVSTDEDVENMMEEFERISSQKSGSSGGGGDGNNLNRVARLRLFLFLNNGGGEEQSDTPRSRTSSIASLLGGSRKRENWFLDALNGGAGGPSLERRRSEASSIVSEVPDYLFGLDNSDDTSAKLKNRVGLGDGVPGSDPGSPAFGSSSSASQLPILPPVKTKLENPNQNPNPVEMSEPKPQQEIGYGGPIGGQVWGPGSNPGSPYQAHNYPVQQMPFYYVQAGPGQGLVQQRNSNLQPIPVQVPSHFVQQYGPGQGPIPVGYPGPNPVYGPGVVRAVGGMDQYEMQMQGNMVPVSGLGQSTGQSQGQGQGQPVYYGVKNTGYPGMVLPVSGEDMAGYGPPGSEAPAMGRTGQS